MPCCSDSDITNALTEALAWKNQDYSVFKWKDDSGEFRNDSEMRITCR